ncbi:MAG TPA: LacI family DNA-binding transcriptional regulator [Arachnia sp.]|nr:LacI family DNA-binding transcriptional regulator [Arachnia sp.]HMT84900.1 LacI family DNA-binding transcriptional regulator [Arachnia sp.]
MRQVAALAGVGTKTVSRVINHEPNVSSATSQRVWEAVRALDYHVDLLAGSLRRSGGRTHALGLLVGSVQNPFSGAIHRAVEDAAGARGVAVFASSLDDDPEREEGAVHAFLRRRVDGLILTTTSQRQDYLATTRDRGVPTVFIDRLPSDPDTDTVVSDNRVGARLATAHLIAHGHRRIALLTDRLSIQTAAERRLGFLDALGAAGIPAAETTMVTEVHDEARAEAVLAQLLSSESPPTAVLSAQNLITIGALHALRAAGRRHSVALIGFDDIPLADLVDPGITVMAQDPHRIGALAAEQVFARIDGDTSEPRHLVVPTVLIERGSGEISPAP